MTPRLSGHGLDIQLPARWEGRIYQRTAPGVSPATAARTAAINSPGGQPHPVMHLANFALPASRGDFGTGAVETMGPQHIFVAVVEYAADCLDTALYAPRGIPTLTAAQFNPNGLQRRIVGQSGFQHFFTEGGRPFCLYVVLGSHRHAAALCGEVNTVLGRLEVVPA
jgi:hypothetical protein